ncbi:hypothetical protein BpHYR1_027263 [Brachionus plicatilis]|uniref:Uncharacterized protein n=1 Tax=Brachionus plicatilis TaxID=10195 RepID=A0A3M7S7B1_BRAPC|nr:hypothetical protein BpHYR1_027263 [Brachionus plicatilis]
MDVWYVIIFNSQVKIQCEIFRQQTRNKTKNLLKILRERGPAKHERFFLIIKHKKSVKNLGLVENVNNCSQKNVTMSIKSKM